MGRTHPNLVGHWRFENNLLDTSGNGNNGTVGAGSAAYVRGRIGQAWDGDTTRYVNLPVTASVRGNAQVTATMWVKFTAADFKSVADHIYFENTVSSALFRFDISTQPNGTLRFRGRGNDSDSLTVWVTSNSAVPKNEWIHIACVYDAPNTIARIYFNGVQDASAAIANKTFTDAAPFDLSIGGRPDLPARNWEGPIDDVQIYNAAARPNIIRAILSGVDPIELGDIA
jgi:hypothetical protein